MKHPILWIFGNTGAGKTTLAKEFVRRFGAFHLDGDILQKETGNFDMSPAGRRCRCLGAAKEAERLCVLGPVVVSMITPYEDLRMQIKELVDPLFIYLPYGKPASVENPFEEPIIEHFVHNRVAKTVSFTASGCYFVERPRHVVVP